MAGEYGIAGTHGDVADSVVLKRLEPEPIGVLSRATAGAAEEQRKKQPKKISGPVPKIIDDAGTTTGLSQSGRFDSANIVVRKDGRALQRKSGRPAGVLQRSERKIVTPQSDGGLPRKNCLAGRRC